MRQEQRKYPRIPVDLPAQASWNQETFPLRIVDVSQGGCQISCGLPIPVGELLLVSFPAGISLRPFKTRIMWAKQEGGVLRAGTAFWGMEENLQIYLANRLAVAGGAARNSGEEESPFLL